MANRMLDVCMVVAVALVLTACATTDSEPTPSQTAITKGPVPESARMADGSIDMSQVPDFIPASDGDGIAGWIASSDVLPPPGEARPEIATVYADDLVTVVGRDLAAGNLSEFYFTITSDGGLAVERKP